MTGRRSNNLRLLSGALAGVLGTAALAYCSAAHAQVNVSMTADRTRIGVDEEVAVQIRVESKGISSPDIELPSFDAFDVVNQQVSRPMQFSFSFGTGAGARRESSSSTIYNFVLRPRIKGRVTIQPVRVKLDDRVYQSRPLTIFVDPNAGGRLSSGPPGPEPNDTQPAQPEPPSGVLDGARYDPQAFIRTMVDKPEAFVGEQVTVTIYLYLRGNLSSLPPVESEPATDGFWVRDLLPPSRTLEATRQVVDDTIFRVYLLRRFAAFPLRSGDLVIGPLKIRIEQSSLPDIFDMFDLLDRGAAPTLRRAGVPVTIRVKELPQAGKPGSEVAVGRFEIAAKLDRAEVRTGDAVTLTATVRGQGNIQTVKLAAPQIEGLQILAPQISDVVEAPGDVVGGSRVFEWLVVPEKPGRYELGPIQLETFDPEAKTYRRVQAPSPSLTAAGTARERTDKTPIAEREETADSSESAAASFGPIRTASALARGGARVVTSPWYFALLALGPLGWMLVLATSLVRQSLAARAEKTGPQRAAREAKGRLRAAAAAADRADPGSCYGEIASAIQELLGARLGVAISGFTRSELRAYLAERGMSEPLAGETLQELESCDFARFSSAGADPKEMRDAVKRAQELLKKLSAFEPKRMEP